MWSRTVCLNGPECHIFKALYYASLDSMARVCAGAQLDWDDSFDSDAGKFAVAPAADLTRPAPAAAATSGADAWMTSTLAGSSSDGSSVSEGSGPSAPGGGARGAATSSAAPAAPAAASFSDDDDDDFLAGLRPPTKPSTPPAPPRPPTPAATAPPGSTTPRGGSAGAGGRPASAGAGAGAAHVGELDMKASVSARAVSQISGLLNDDLHDLQRALPASLVFSLGGSFPGATLADVAVLSPACLTPGPGKLDYFPEMPEALDFLKV